MAIGPLRRAAEALGDALIRDGRRARNVAAIARAVLFRRGADAWPYLKTAWTRSDTQRGRQLRVPPRDDRGCQSATAMPRAKTPLTLRAGAHLTMFVLQKADRHLQDGLLLLQHLRQFFAVDPRLSG